MAAGLPPDPPLDPTVSPGQSGHIDDHEDIAGTLAMLREAAGMTVAEIGTDLAAAGAVADALALKADSADLGTAAAMTPTEVVEDAGAQASLSGAFASQAMAASLDAAPPSDISANEAWGLPGNVATALTTLATSSGTLYYFPVLVDAQGGITLTDVQLEVTVAGSASATGRLVIATANENWQPVALYSNEGTVAIDSLGQQSWTPALAMTRGRYLFGLHVSAGATFRAISMSPKSGTWLATGGMSANPFIIAAARSTANPETVPNFSTLLAGNTPGLRCPFIAKWTVTDDPF